jgi:hypothetical protein
MNLLQHSFYTVNLVNTFQFIRRSSDKNIYIKQNSYLNTSDPQSTHKRPGHDTDNLGMELVEAFLTSKPYLNKPLPEQSPFLNGLLSQITFNRVKAHQNHTSPEVKAIIRKLFDI